MQIKDLGEFALIDRLHALLAGEPLPADVVLGIGDDTAVLGVDDPLLLATVDSQVDGVHFLADVLTPEQIGWRALAVNLSDIAAMGGQPRYALVALLLPDTTPVAWAEGVYRGLQQAANTYGVTVVGGNVSRLPERCVLDVTVIGQVPRSQVLRRSGAQVGDLVLVTGDLGAGAAGLLVAREWHTPGVVRAALAPADAESLLLRYATPAPRLHQAAVIAASHAATAMLDLSDGLSSDIGHICQQSGVGVRLDAAALPVLDATRQAATAAGSSALRLALAGGDDYELCLTAPPARVPDLVARVQAATGTALTVVGEIRPLESGRWLRLPDGQEVPLAAHGWQHFGQTALIGSARC